MPRIESVLGALALLTAAGCKAGPDYKAPETPVSPAWSGIAAERADGKAGVPAPLPIQAADWWTAFQDPILDGLVRRAVASNRDLRVAAARVREARAACGVASAGLWPAVSADGQYSRWLLSENGAQLGLIPPGFVKQDGLGENLFHAGFDAAWEIDLFGRTRRSMEAAEADAESAQENLRDILVVLLAEVARSYVELRGTQRRLEIARENVRLQEETLDLVRSRFQAGLAGEVDVARAEGPLATIRAQAPALEAAVRQAIYRLGVLLGQEPGALLAELSGPAPLPLVPPEVPIGLPSELLRRRPDIRRAERELAAATARIGVATADLYPRFSLVGSVGQESLRFPDLVQGTSSFWNIGPSIAWPIFAGGRIRSAIEVQDARQEQALGRYEKAILTALADVENSLIAYVREQSRRESLLGAVAANRRARELANQLYAQGLTEFLDVLAADRSLNAAQDQLAVSEQAVVTDLVALYKALGGGWEVFEVRAPRVGLDPE